MNENENQTSPTMRRLHQLLSARFRIPWKTPWAQDPSSSERNARTTPVSALMVQLSEPLYRALVTEAPMGIAIVENSRVVHANPRLCDMLGCDHDMLVGAGIETLIHPDDRLARLALAGHFRQYEVQRCVTETRCLRRGGGGTVHVRIHAALVAQPAERPSCHVAVFEDISEFQETEQRLREHARQISGLSARLLAANEEERRHLARELHDEIGQVLTAAHLALLQARNSNPANAESKVLKDSAAVVENAITRVRQLSMDLRPPMLDDLGLITSLRELCCQHRQRARMAVDFECLGDDAAIPDDLVVTLYRICQEALTNVARHARATRVQVRFGAKKGLFVLIVRDNGAGFDLTELTGNNRFGILGMRERVKMHGGTLDIESSPGGTDIVAVFARDEMPQDGSRYSSAPINPVRTA